LGHVQNGDSSISPLLERETWHVQFLRLSDSKATQMHVTDFGAFDMEKEEQMQITDKRDDLGSPGRQLVRYLSLVINLGTRCTLARSPSLVQSRCALSPVKPRHIRRQHVEPPIPTASYESKDSLSICISTGVYYNYELRSWNYRSPVC
jgi:hypothetical protein